MKGTRIAFLCFISLAFSGLAQDSTQVVINGFVKSSDDEPIQNVTVSLALPGSYTFDCKTAADGSYEFKFHLLSPSSCTLSVSYDRSSSSNRIKNGNFLSSKEKAIIPELWPNQHYVKDFMLQSILCTLYTPPILYFKTNSLLPAGASSAQPGPGNNETLESFTSYLFEMLRENPSMVIEICGVASGIEKNREQLSLERAGLIQKELIAKGIDPARLAMSVRDSNKLRVTDEQIKKARSREEKRYLHARNQRVVFRIISWDFKK